MSGFLGKPSDKDSAKIGYVMSQQLPSIRRSRNAITEVGSRGGKEQWSEKESRKENG